MNISIIIPNYNGEELLKKNLPKVLEAFVEYKRGNVELIIPDDDSTDNSNFVIEDFRKKFKEHGIELKSIENIKKAEKGFSKNVNRGVNIATGDILILLNSDVSPDKNFLKPLLKHFDDPQVFAVGCLEESRENGKIVLRGRGLGKFNRGFLIHRRGEVDKDDTLWVSGGSGAFRKSIWDSLQGFDEIYNPFYWEDIDLSYRALKCGYKIYFEPKSVVVHEHDEGVIKNEYPPSFVKQISYRNQFIFVWKNITEPNYKLLHIIWLLYLILKSIFTKDWEFVKGFNSAVLKLPQIFYSRNFVKKQFTIADSELLSRYKYEQK